MKIVTNKIQSVKRVKLSKLIQLFYQHTLFKKIMNKNK